MEKPLSPKKKGFVVTMAQLVESHLIKSGIPRTKTELPNRTPKTRNHVGSELESSQAYALEVWEGSHEPHFVAMEGKAQILLSTLRNLFTLSSLSMFQLSC